MMMMMMMLYGNIA